MKDLSIRYPPASSVTAEDHARRIELLAGDLRGFPFRYVEQAIKHWVRSSSYFPKTADLVLLIKNFIHGSQPDTSMANAKRLAAERNEKIAIDNPNFSGRWIADANGSLTIVPKNRSESRPEPNCTPEQATAIMKEFGIKSSILAPIMRNMGRGQ